MRHSDMRVETCWPSCMQVFEGVPQTYNEWFMTESAAQSAQTELMPATRSFKVAVECPMLGG